MGIVKTAEYTKEQLRGKKVAVLGMGMEGVALANFLDKYQAEITLCDKLPKGELEKRALSEGDNSLLKMLENNSYKHQLGEEYLENLKDFDIVFRSPGIPYLHQKIQEAMRAGVQISSQIKLFFDLCPCPIIGVTGTKGKGTTATLIKLMLQKHQETRYKSQTNFNSQVSNSHPNNNRTPLCTDATRGTAMNQFNNIYLAGNIGEPAIALIDQLSKNDIVVLELSSFQLQDIEKSPHIAVVTNISVDHLDYHKDEAEYHQAKQNIVKYQKSDDFAVINQDYLTAYQLASQTIAQVYYFSGKESVDRGAFVRRVTTTDLLHGSDTDNSDNNRTIEPHFAQTLRGARQSNNEAMKQLNNEIHEVVLKMDDRETIICRSDEVMLIGHHNLENITSASVAAYLAGADIVSISNIAKSFAGLPHRIEFVAEIKGIKFYNDSYATNPEPTMAAIKSFDSPIHLILGGSSKKADFTSLSQKITNSMVTSVTLIGDEGENIKNALARANFSGKIDFADGDFGNIIKSILKIANGGDIVLLSPACASFGLFKNYKDRGEKFKSAVNQIHQDESNN